MGESNERPESGDSAGEEYRALLGNLSMAKPRLAAPLIRAESSRAARVDQLAGGARFAGLEELLATLDSVAERFEEHAKLSRAAHLVRRATADIETAIEASLSGYMGVVNDAMRDVLEIENLLRDFALDLERLDVWFTADDNTRWKRFRPVVVRERLKAAGLLGDAHTDLDYAAHSRHVHVTPDAPPIARRGLASSTETLFDVGFFEVFYHAGRLWSSLLSLAESVAGVDQVLVPQEEDLSAVTDAWWRIDMMMWLHGFRRADDNAG